MTTLEVGNQAPHFVSNDQNNKPFDSKTLMGKKWVLYFYPKDLTPGCTVQACNLRDNYTKLQEEGIVIIGVSMDDANKHQKFIDKHKLPFPLMADIDKKLILSYGVWGEKKFMGKVYDGIHRTTFVMDESSTIVGIIRKPKNKIHTEEIMKVYAESSERK